MTLTWSWIWLFSPEPCWLCTLGKLWRCQIQFGRSTEKLNKSCHWKWVIIDSIYLPCFSNYSWHLLEQGLSTIICYKWINESPEQNWKLFDPSLLRFTLLLCQGNHKKRVLLPKKSDWCPSSGSENGAVVVSFFAATHFLHLPTQQNRFIFTQAQFIELCLELG